MADYTIKDGGDLMVFLKVAGSGETQDTVTLAFATSHKLSVQAETVENTNKDCASGKWVSKIVKKMSWTISSENLFIEKGDATKKQKAYGDLFDLMAERKPIDLVFTEASNIDEDVTDIPASGWTAATEGTYTGKAIITSLEANAGAGDNATYSVNFEGVGKLTHVAAK